MKKILIAVLFVLLIPSSFAQPIGHITLLAVSEATQTGSTADLYISVNTSL